MDQYLNSLKHIMQNGTDKSNRTGIDTRGVFGYQMRFDLSKGFPAMTTKRLAWRSVVSELLWMIEGSSDERRLAEIHYGKPREELIGKSTIWTANADQQGRALGHKNTDTIKELGPVYGVQWRSWAGPEGDIVDQLQSVLEGIYYDPNGRRHIISAWNPSDIHLMALPPCHCLFHFLVENGKLSCLLYQRSCDMFLGVPFNIASYSLLTHICAKILRLDVGEFIWTGGDCHIYHNHFDAVNEQLSRTSRQLPTLEFPEISTLNEVKLLIPENFILNNYNPMDTIRAEMAV